MEYIASYHELGEMLESVAALHNESQDARAVMKFESNTTSPSMQWQCVDNRLSVTEIEQSQTFSFWVEGIIQCSLGLVGIVANIVAIIVLSSPKMQSIFNKLLICLMSVYIVVMSVAIFDEIIWPAWVDKPRYISGEFFLYLFTYTLRPVKQTMRYSSIFITTVMARHRFLALCHPIQYRNSEKSSRPWKSAIKIFIPILTVSLLLTIPLFLEVSVEYENIGNVFGLNETHLKYVSIIELNKGRAQIPCRYHYLKT